MEKGGGGQWIAFCCEKELLLQTRGLSFEEGGENNFLRHGETQEGVRAIS